jgi:hypothetical protein
MARAMNTNPGAKHGSLHLHGVAISVATVMTDVFQKNGIMVSIKLLKP